MLKMLGGRPRSVLAALTLCCGLVVTTAVGSSAAECRNCAPGARSAGYVRNLLNGVAAVSRSDAWAVGYAYNGSADTALVEHWHGGRWRISTSPNPGSAGSALYGVAAVAGTSAWAVGDTLHNVVGYTVSHTLIEHWNGRRWSVQPSPNPLPGNDQLTGVAALSSSNVWAVGASDLLQRTLIEHWNGSKWQVEASPSPGSIDSVLTSVAAISPSNVWAVGYTDDMVGDNAVFHTLIEHWNGSRWAVSASPDPGIQASLLNGVAAAGPSHVWAVGTFDTGSIQTALIARWTGRGWTMQASPTSAFGIDLQSATAVSGTLAWAAGYTGSRTLAEHWNGQKWHIQHTPDPIFSPDPQLALNGVAALSGSNAWAVGYSGELNNPGAKTLIEHWNGRSWQTQPSPNLP